MMLLYVVIIGLQCLVTEIPELKEHQFPCPDGVLSVTVSGDHELLEEYVRLDVDREEMNVDMLPPMIAAARTGEAMQAAIKTYRWIENKGYDLDEFQYTVEDRKGRYICTINIVSDGDAVKVTGGDCAGVGKK